MLGTQRACDGLVVDLAAPGQEGPCRCGGSAWQRLPRLPQRVRRSTRLPGSGSPKPAISAALLLRRRSVAVQVLPQATNRRRRARSRSRVVDAVWTSVEAHLPCRPPDTHPLGCHRPRTADRDCFVGILTHLVTGCSWEVAARQSAAGETTLRNRRTQWLTAGVFDKVVEEAIAA